MIAVIPAYEPDENLEKTVSELISLNFFVVVVDDGSSPNKSAFFERVKKYAVLLCQEKSQNKQTKSYQPTRGSEERAEFLYKFSKSFGERKSQ